MVTQLQPRTTHSRTVTLQGLGWSTTAPALPVEHDRTPTLLKRTDPDFIAAILDELKRDAVFQPNSPLHQSVLKVENPLTLLQPVHRTFYVALLEIVCNSFDIPGLQPRLDPKQIHSAGLVVRRVGTNEIHEAWQTKIQPDGSRKKCWFPLIALTEDLDPDPTYQKSPPSTGHRELDRQLQSSVISRHETVSNLYVAPPDLCNHLKRTVLYGVIPVTSNEVSEVSPITAISEIQNVNEVSEAIAKMLPPYLRSSGMRDQPINRILNKEDAISRDNQIQDFINTLRQLKFHFQMFENIALMKELNQITVQLSNFKTKPLGDLLQQATQILVDRQDGQVELPTQWPPILDDQSKKIFNLLQGNLLNRLSEFGANEGRFEDNNRSYKVRAFIRLHADAPCPPRIIWSEEYSPAFRIAPWYANGEAPPVKVALPDVMDFQTLKNLKPNVAFSVPSKLFDLLNSQDKDPRAVFKDGIKSGQVGIGINWICSFNIPIITLCAYIVLNLFLKLFDLIFWWMFMIKICIPIPVPKPKP